MKTNEHEASRLLALDALAFADQISPEWPLEKQVQHLREQIELAKGHLEGDSNKAAADIQRIADMRALLAPGASVTISREGISAQIGSEQFNISTGVEMEADLEAVCRLSERRIRG